MHTKLGAERHVGRKGGACGLMHMQFYSAISREVLSWESQTQWNQNKS